MEEKEGYDWKRTLWKFAKSAGYVILAGVVSVYGNSPWYLAIAPLLTAAENFLKHIND